MSAERKYRVLTAEQYVAGYYVYANGVVIHVHYPPTPKEFDGTYIVQEPQQHSLPAEAPTDG